MGNANDGMIRRVLLWKKEYGSVYLVRISTREYFFRPLTRREYLTIFGIQDKSVVDICDAILHTCLLWPKFKLRSFDNKLAGEVDDLARAIIRTSGFSETDKLLADIEVERESLGALENQIIVLICRAFPHLRLSDISNFTYEDMLKHLVISEAILDIKLNIEKPKPSKEGSIDFDAENRESDPLLPRKNLKTPRG